MVDSEHFKSVKRAPINSNMDFSTALNNVYRNLCSSSNIVGNNQEYMTPLPLFPFPLLLQQLASNNSNNLNNSASSVTSNSSLISPTTAISQAQATPLKTSNSFDSNTTSSKFHGRHSIWRHFRVARDENVYRCLVEECTAAYTWPPSTTVAGRHLRDKHPDIYAQVLNEEADRRNRKRAAEVGSNNTSMTISQPLSATLSDGSYSPPSSNPLGTPQPADHLIVPQNHHFAMETNFKRFKYDEEFLKQMGILHFATTEQPSFDPFISVSQAPTMDFTFKQENDDLSERHSTTETIVANGGSQEHEWKNKKQVDSSLVEEVERLRSADTANRVKVQKLQENLKDEREQLENLKSRNEVLEKRGQNVNNDIQVHKDKIDELQSVKDKLERDLSETTSKLNQKTSELQELRDQNTEIRTNLSRTRRELDEITDNATRGGSTTEAEVATLRKSKRDLEQKIVELEDQLDDVQGQNEILEQNVTRLNLNLERVRSDAQRSGEAKEEELDECRSQFQRRLQVYEEQIAELNEANASLQKQVRLLEQRGRQFETQSQYSFESSTNNYKREYKKTLAMLKDTQNLLTIERQKSDKTSLIRRLRSQLDEAEEARMSAIRAKTSLESDLAELNVEIENVRISKASLENRVKLLVHEKSEAVLASKDIEEQLNNALHDYRNTLAKSEQNNSIILSQSQQLAELETEKQKLSVQLAEIEGQASNYRSNYVEAHKLQLLESRLNELKARADYERLEKQKFEANAQRLEDEVDRLQDQLNELHKVVGKQQDQIQKHKREILSEQERVNEMRKTNEELEYKCRKTREEFQDLEDEYQHSKSDLLLAQRRIEGLQAALNAGSDIEEDDRNELELSDLDEEEEAHSVTTTTETSHNNSGDQQIPSIVLNESID